MKEWKFLKVMSAAIILGGAFSSEAVAGNSANVRRPDDVKITAVARQLIAQHPDLGPPNQIYVATHDHVLYLSGVAVTPLASTEAERIARQTPGVARVVSTISGD